MGSCLSKCYSEIQRLSCWKTPAKLDDQDRLMDQPSARPLSISSWLSCVRGQLGSENEELELQEETAVDASKEAQRIKKFADNQNELINPARLALDNNIIANGPEHSLGAQVNSKDKFDPANDLDDLDHRHHSGSSPSSSVDLEWENEDGLSPVTHLPDRGDISSDTASCISQLSTPVSNGNEELEWDGHFTSTHISHLDMETERLICEIERLTTGALEDNECNDR